MERAAPTQLARPVCPLRTPSRTHVDPFMNTMDEISYWVCTKRAPCLYNYDNVIKRQCEEAHCSKPQSVQSIVLEKPTPKKKKKRKLLLIDDESVSTRKQLYFDTSQKKNHHVSHKSDSIGSDIDFNIKNSPIQDKCKRAKLNKSNRTAHKKNEIVTSTPKVTANLRRSLRKNQRSTNNNSNHDNSFKTYNCDLTNANNNTKYVEIEKSVGKTHFRKTEILAGGNQSIEKRICNNKTQKTPVNGQFDDLSDVSGFTANYIRSTKIHSAKRNLRNKGGRNFIKGSQNTHDGTLLVCVNNAGNMDHKAELLNSTDSSQNIVNLITLKNNKSTRGRKITPQLKFIDSKPSSKEPVCNDLEPSSNINISFQSKSSITSRYPKRHKNRSIGDILLKFDKKLLNSGKRLRVSKNSVDNSDRKENPEDNVSRTRSGKCIGLTVRQAENSVLHLSNSVEQVSSTSMKAATPTIEPRSRSKRRKCTNSQIEAEKKQTHGEPRYPVREKSGFTAFFSDSDEDNVPLKEKKFFC